MLTVLKYPGVLFTLFSFISCSSVENVTEVNEARMESLRSKEDIVNVNGLYEFNNHRTGDIPLKIKFEKVYTNGKHINIWGKVTSAKDNSPVNNCYIGIVTLFKVREGSIKAVIKETNSDKEGKFTLSGSIGKNDVLLIDNAAYAPQVYYINKLIYN